MNVFIAALFTMAKTWKQPKCPSTDNWIRKIHTIEYYSVIKTKKIMPFATTWMELETLILSEVMSERERQKPYYITHIWNLIYGTNEPLHRKENHGLGE